MNVLAFLSGLGLSAVLFVIWILLLITVGHSLAALAGVVSTVVLGVKWRKWIRYDKEFAVLALIGLVIGVSVAVDAIYLLRHMPATWFE